MFQHILSLKNPSLIYVGILSGKIITRKENYRWQEGIKRDRKPVRMESALRLEKINTGRHFLKEKPAGIVITVL